MAVKASALGTAVSNGRRSKPAWLAPSARALLKTRRGRGQPGSGTGLPNRPPPPSALRYPIVHDSAEAATAAARTYQGRPVNSAGLAVHLLLQ